MSLLDLPNAGKYRVIYSDPPWRYSVFSEKGRGRSAERHYQTMPLEEIKLLPVNEVAAKDCHLFMWATGPCLSLALELMAAWGFNYSTVAFTWAKLNRSHGNGQLRFTTTIEREFFLGMGHTTRANAEFCLLGRKGAPRRNSKAVRSLIVDPIREHSRKPDKARERIEVYSDGPYLEMFARESAPGWDSWGNETSKFDGTPADVKTRRLLLPRRGNAS